MNTCVCQCATGVLGDSCGFPCPGVGTDDFGAVVGQACSGRGQCGMSDFVPIPQNYKEAKALTRRLLETGGVGRFKTASDYERLTGIVVVSGAINWEDDDTVPPVYDKEDRELNLMKETLASHDMDAKCTCNQGNVAGKACHVVCPTWNGDICRGRTPILEEAGAGMRVDDWFGEQVWHQGQWVNSKNGCMYGLHDDGLTQEGFAQALEDRADRDPIRDAENQPMKGVRGPPLISALTCKPDGRCGCQLPLLGGSGLFRERLHMRR